MKAKIESIKIKKETDTDADTSFLGEYTDTLEPGVIVRCHNKYYEDLTEEEVLDWVWENGVNKTSVENVVKQEINAQKTPPTVSPPLPWRAKRNAAQPNPGGGKPPENRT